MSIPSAESESFTTAVHGTVFADRAAVVQRLREGDRLILVPDPINDESDDPPAVWVHAGGGDVVGHLPTQVARWMAPAMLDGARYAAVVLAVGGSDVASWKRLTVEVRSLPASPPPS